MKRVLLISHSFPPSLEPESMQAGITARALARLGWKISVLTVRERNCLASVDEALLEGMPSSIRVFRSYSAERLVCRSRAVGDIMLRTLQRLGMPVAASPWCPFAVREGRRLLSTCRYDVIYSRAFSPASNIVGLKLRYATGLPWVAHFSDPWLDGPYYRPKGLHGYNCRRLEREIIGQADGVVFTTRQAAELVMGKYPVSWSRKAQVIPHGYDPEELPARNRCRQRRPRMRIVYTGSFYGPRTPTAFLQALLRPPLRDRLSEIEVIFVGPAMERWKREVACLGLTGVVRFAGQASRAESLRMVVDADLALLIDAPSSGPSVYLPSKLVDYMSTRRPILGLTPEMGASADLLHGLGCPVVAPQDIGAIAGTLGNLLSLWKTGELAVLPQFEAMTREYDIHSVTHALDDLLRQVATA